MAVGRLAEACAERRTCLPVPSGDVECAPLAVTLVGFVLGARPLQLTGPSLRLPRRRGRVRSGLGRRPHAVHAAAPALWVASAGSQGTESFCLFQVAAKCYQKGGASEKERLALAHHTALNMKSKKVSPK